MELDKVKEFIKHNLVYNKHRGELLWKTDRAGGKVKAGSLAGSTNKGYLQIRIHGHWYKVHRLIWLLEKGVFPEHQIDHFNKNKKDNRIENLRDVSNYTNCLNRSLGNSSGLTGVTYDKINKKWLAQTYIEGRNVNLGRYSTKEEAHKAYLHANKERLTNEVRSKE